MAIRKGFASRVHVSPRGAQTGGVAGAIIFLLLIGAGVYIYMKLNAPPEAQYSRPDRNFESPRSTFDAWLAAREPYAKRTDPYEGMIRCMTTEDIIWFDENKGSVATLSPYGDVGSIGSDSERRHLALTVLLDYAPEPGDQIVNEYTSGDKCVLVYKKADNGRNASFRLVKEGQNWKVLHWFDARYLEVGGAWIANVSIMDHIDLTSLDQDIPTTDLSPGSFDYEWLFGNGKAQYAQEVRDFYQAVGAPLPPNLERRVSLFTVAGESSALERLMYDYSKTAYRFVEEGSNPQEALYYHSSDDQEWFRTYWGEIAAMHGAAPDSPEAQKIALKALLNFGPTSPYLNVETENVKVAGDQALVKFKNFKNGKNVEYAVCLQKEQGEWKILDFFFARNTMYMPQIIQAKQQRGEALTPEETQYLQNGRQRFQAKMRQLYNNVGEKIQ